MDGCIPGSRRKLKAASSTVRSSSTHHLTRLSVCSQRLHQLWAPRCYLYCEPSHELDFLTLMHASSWERPYARLATVPAPRADERLTHLSTDWQSRLAFDKAAVSQEARKQRDEYACVRAFHRMQHTLRIQRYFTARQQLESSTNEKVKTSQVTC